MSSIFKKLSVILCCLFGLISINPATWAKPGDYLVYFLGKDEDNVLECGKCHKYLRLRSGQFCCPNHCADCSALNMWGKLSKGCGCGVGNAYQLLQKYGPFCFIKYENGGDFDAVFEDAKNSRELYCAYCMAKELKGNFDGQIFVNVPKTTYSFPSKFKGGLGFEFEVLFDKVFKLDGIEDNLKCPKCQRYDDDSCKLLKKIYKKHTSPLPPDDFPPPPLKFLSKSNK